MKNPIVHIAAVVAMFFWGMSFIWSKIVFGTYPPLTTITIRLTLSFLVLFAYLVVSRQFERVKKQDIKLFLATAFFNPFLYFIGEYFGLSMVSASISAIIISTIPLLTPFVAQWFFKERLGLINFLGLALAFIGVLIIVLKNDLSLDASGPGIAFLFLAVLAAVIYSVLVKKLTSEYSPVTIITWQNFIGTLLFLPLFLYFDFNGFITISPDLLTVASLIMLAVFSSSISLVLYAYVLKRLTLTKANIYNNLTPVFTAVASFFFLDESFSLIKITGMAVVIGGIALSQLKFKKF
jgi:drug/metabolite transporter (DMT)-like permease